MVVGPLRRGLTSLRLLGVLLSLGLAGCSSVLTAGTADVAGVAGAGIANAVGRSPAAATGIGLGVAAGFNAGLQYVERDVHAEAAGKLRPGMIGTWQVVHDIPIEDNESGEVMVTHDIGGPDFACKEIVFSVDTVKDKKPARAFYTATVCRDGAVWKWATAEPAIARWGALQ